jgi:hypothetical protein
MSFDLNKIYDSIKTQISALPVVKTYIDASVNVPTSSIEHFTLPPYTQDARSFKDQLDHHPDDPLLKELIKYNVDQREVYDVIKDFDQTPNNLSDNKKTLRKKYLNIVLSVMDDKNDMVKTAFTQMASGPMFQGPMGGQGPIGGQGQGPMEGPDQKMKEMFLLYGLGNYDPGYNTIKRIIKLLIMEIDLNGSTTCPVCATNTESKQVCPTCPVCPVCQTPPACPVCPVCPEDKSNTYIGVIVGLVVLLVIMSIIFAMGSGGGNHAPTPNF